MAGRFSALVAHVTGGRRFSFVIMSYHEGYAFFERIRQIVAEATGFECIRADDLPQAGEDLREKLHEAIDNSVFVIADVSDSRPNIYYEVGFAAARNKPILLLANEKAELHTDLAGLEVIRYEESRVGWPAFEKVLRQHLEIHRDSNVSLIRTLLLPADPTPSFVVVNPKLPQADSRITGHPRERRTYGDYLGVAGIVGAFVSVYGESRVPEIVSAAHADDALLEWDANLFLIGSPKVNRFTGLVLDRIGPPRAGWRFQPCPGEQRSGDYEVQLLGDLPNGPFETPCGQPRPPGNAGLEDFGLIVRVPHPRHPDRTILILAGAHSLGTGAACLVATKPQLLRIAADRLSSVVELTDRRATMWVLVKGRLDDSAHLEASGVTIVDVGVL